MHDTDQENLPPVDLTPRANPAMQSTALQAGGEVDDAVRLQSTALQAGGEVDDAVHITKVTRTTDPMWTVELSDDDEGDTAAPSAAAELSDHDEGDTAATSAAAELSDNDEGDTAAPPAAAVVKSEPDCMEIDDPLGPESNERHLQHVRASNRNRSRLMYIKMEESAEWEAAAKKRNRLNARLPYVKIEESGHGEKERKSSGAAPRKKRKEPEGPDELAQHALKFSYAQRGVLEASFSESTRCPAALDDLVDRLNGLKDAGGKTASAENVRKWFRNRRNRPEASKGPEGPSIAVPKEVKKCVADMIKKLEEPEGPQHALKFSRPLKKRKEPEGPAEMTQRSRYFNSEQRRVLEASVRESNQCPAGLGDLVDRLNGLKADKGKDASKENVRASNDPQLPAPGRIEASKAATRTERGSRLSNEAEGGGRTSEDGKGGTYTKVRRTGPGIRARGGSGRGEMGGVMRETRKTLSVTVPVPVSVSVAVSERERARQ